MTIQRNFVGWTYCQVKLPVMPSFNRSRSDRCLLGPEPALSGGKVGLPRCCCGALEMDMVVGLPEIGLPVLPDIFETDGSPAT